uniref:Uncharacterized protein n=1 Tax=Meloidogyne enterolobii TaxID=390850 RepID=A0A6V7V077_MELEN|nr:unnamed protein product [Meloidogyne enterolobii]
MAQIPPRIITDCGKSLFYTPISLTDLLVSVSDIVTALDGKNFHLSKQHPFSRPAATKRFKKRHFWRSFERTF